MSVNYTAALLIVFGLVGVTAPVGLQAQMAGETVFVESPVDGDFYAAGGEIEVLAPIGGDAVLAGGTVRLSDRVGEDVIAAGGDVRLFGSVGDDARLAGGHVDVQGTVAGHLVAAGGDVAIAKGASVGDFAWLAGGRLEIAGRVGGDLKAAGREIVLTGRIDGDAELVAETIRIADDAIVGGNLTWRSPAAPDIDASADIAGRVTGGDYDDADDEPRDAWLGGLFTIIGLTVTAGVLFSLFPAWCGRLAGIARARPVVTPVTGLAAIATTPFVIVLLFVTVVGVLLGLLTTLGYVLLLMLGFVLGVVVAARLVLDRFGKVQADSLAMNWLVIALVAVVLVVFGAIPLVGFLVAIATWCYGTGALVLDTFTKMQGERR